MIERGTPGFKAGKKEDKLGVRSSDTSELVFEDCRVPAKNLLGREGSGFEYVVSPALDSGRYSIAWAGVALSQRACEEMVDYASRREQFGQRIALIGAHPLRKNGPCRYSRIFVVFHKGSVQQDDATGQMQAAGDARAHDHQLTYIGTGREAL